MRATEAPVPRGKESPEGVGAPQGLRVNGGGTFYPKPPRRQGEHQSLRFRQEERASAEAPEGAGRVPGPQVTVPAESQLAREAEVRSQAEGRT